MLGEGGQDRLADPPDGVADELDAVVGIELPGRRHQPHVPLLDQVQEGHPPVLVLLGHGDHEAEVGADQQVKGPLVARAGAPGDPLLLVGAQQRVPAQVVQVEVQGIPDLARGRPVGRSTVSGHLLTEGWSRGGECPPARRSRDRAPASGTSPVTPAGPRYFRLPRASTRAVDAFPYGVLSTVPDGAPWPGAPRDRWSTSR